MTKAQVLEATQAVWKPDQMTILAVGNYADWDGDFTEFGPVTMVDITIPEPALEVPEATPASLEAGKALMAVGRDGRRRRRPSSRASTATVEKSRCSRPTSRAWT